MFDKAHSNRREDYTKKSIFVHISCISVFKVYFLKCLLITEPSLSLLQEYFCFLFVSVMCWCPSSYFFGAIVSGILFKMTALLSHFLAHLLSFDGLLLSMLILSLQTQSNLSKALLFQYSAFSLSLFPLVDSIHHKYRFYYALIYSLFNSLKYCLVINNLITVKQVILSWYFLSYLCPYFLFIISCSSCYHSHIFSQEILMISLSRNSHHFTVPSAVFFRSMTFFIHELPYFSSFRYLIVLHHAGDKAVLMYVERYMWV